MVTFLFRCHMMGGEPGVTHVVRTTCIREAWEVFEASRREGEAVSGWEARP